MERIFRSLLCLSFVFICITPAAKGQHLEDVNRRLEILERIWEIPSNDLVRQKASKSVDSLTFLMLTGQYSKAAQTIDAAIAEFQKNIPEKTTPTWSDSLDIKVSKSLINPCTETIQGTLRHTYRSNITAPVTARVRIRWTIDGKEMKSHMVAVPSDSIQFELVSPPNLAIAQIWCETMNEAKNISLANIDKKTVLMIPEGSHFNEKLLAKKNDISLLPNSISKSTWLHKFEEFNSLAANEKELPTHGEIQKLLGLVDVPVEKIKNGRWPEPTSGTDQVLALPMPAGKKIVRVRLPTKESCHSKNIPAVVALHGAGDNENKWIDGYNRLLSNHCQQRGWILICPRNGTEPDLLPLLAKWSGLSIKDVAMVGHSQGGSQSLAFCAKYPGELRGLVALGASGRVGSGEIYRTIPFFVGVGTEDLSFKACESMVEQIRNQGHNKLSFHRYENIGHAMTPLASKKDVLGFLDELFTSTKNEGAQEARPRKSMN